MKRRRFLLPIFLVVLAGIFILINPSLPKNNEALLAGESVKVLRVIDGDTIEVGLNGKKETVRLIGIDTPEVADPRKQLECFGKEASNKLKELLTGKTIILESDPTQGEKDKYGRLLRYVFLNNLNINKFMIQEGYAHEYTYNSNPYKYQLDFIKAEAEARENHRGLWDKNVCKIPQL